MVSVDYWASAPMQRQQRTLFLPTLDEMTAADDLGRLVDEVLAGLDWSAWEAEYGGTRGQVYGSSDRRAAYPASNPVSPQDITATIYHSLGIDPRTHLHDQQGRPPTLTTGKPVEGLFG